MRQPTVGDIVVYFPDKKLPAFHDRGHQPMLPAVVVKVWDNGVVNMRVADADVRVLLDSSVNPPFVFGTPYATDKRLGSWCWKEDVQ